MSSHLNLSLDSIPPRATILANFYGDNDPDLDPLSNELVQKTPQSSGLANSLIETRLYRTYSADSPRGGDGATPLPGGSSYRGKESPDLSVVIRLSIETIKTALTNARNPNNRATILNHLSTISELSDLDLITGQIRLLLTSHHITDEQLEDLKTAVESITSEFECLQSPISKQRPPRFSPSSYQSPSATVEATSSVATKVLPPHEEKTDLGRSYAGKLFPGHSSLPLFQAPLGDSKIPAADQELSNWDDDA